MARKSRWQQFADSFNAVYGTFTDAAQKIESAKVMKQDFNDDAGNPLVGDALEQARIRALADIKTKYGDAAGGLALRSNAAALESTLFENSLNRELRPELLAQRGVLQSGLMSAQINSANAGAANNYANANRTVALTPYDVENAGLTNRGLAADVDVKVGTVDSRIARDRADTATAAANAEVATGTVDSRISSSASQARTDEASATTAEVTAAENLAVTGERVAATLRELEAAAAEASNRVVTAEQATRDNSVIEDIFMESMKLDFETTEAANAWLIEQFAEAGITPQSRLAAAKLVNEFGAEVIGSRAAEIKRTMESAWRSGGLQSLADAYEKIGDGVDAKVERDGDTLRIIIDRGDGLPEVLDEATGRDAENILGARLMARMDSPMTAMQMAAQEASLAQTRAETGGVEARTRLTDAQVTAIASEVEVDEARIRQIDAAINVDNAQVTKLVAQTAGELLKNETYMAEFEANMANLTSQMEARGVATSLDREQIALVAAQITKTYADIERLDPSREMSARERQEFLDEQFTSVVRSVLAYEPDTSPETIRRMREAFEAGMMPTGISHSQN